jgi:hypothetical protein
MPVLEHDTYVFADGASAESIRDALKDYPRVRLAGSQRLKGGIIVVPPHKILCTEARHYLIRDDANGPLITLDSDSALEGRFLWHSNGHDGAGIKMPGGTSRQEVNGSIFMEYIGLCLDLSEPEAGHECNVQRVQAQRSAPEHPGILLPEDEVGTRGIRRFEDCQGAGGRLIALRGCNVTLLSECSTRGDLWMTDKARQCLIEQCRLALLPNESLSIRGVNHVIMQNQISAAAYIFGSGTVYWNYDGGRYLMPGATGHTVLGMGNVAPTVDWSGMTNMVIR